MFATVAERFSNHTNTDNLVFYTDLRIFLVKARKIEIMVKELGALRRLYENHNQAVGWAGDWLEFFMDQFGDNPIPLESIQNLAIY